MIHRHPLNQLRRMVLKYAWMHDLDTLFAQRVDHQEIERMAWQRMGWLFWHFNMLYCVPSPTALYSALSFELWSLVTEYVGVSLEQWSLSNLLQIEKPVIAPTKWTRDVLPCLKLDSAVAADGWIKLRISDLDIDDVASMLTCGARAICSRTILVGGSCPCSSTYSSTCATTEGAN